MPSEEKGFVYSTVKKEEEFLALVRKLFPEDYLVFIENPQDPGKFGADDIPGSIEFPGFIFDLEKEVRWYVNSGDFFVTVISDEPIPDLPEVKGSWTRERIARYAQEPEQNEEEGIYLVRTSSDHINIRSKTLIEYLEKTEILENAELFSRNAVPVFLTLRRWKE